jgi:hypothetical protein
MRQAGEGPVVPPKIWQLFSTYFGLPPPLSRAWYRALEQAQWSEARTFYQTLIVFEARPAAAIDAVVRFTQEIATPAAVVGVLERLRQEGVLRPADVRALEELVLARVDREGRWQ